MKVKLFTFLGLLVAAIAVSITFSATSVQAKGEKYKWVNQSTVEVSGGVYSELDFLGTNNNAWDRRFKAPGFKDTFPLVQFPNATEVGCTIGIDLSIAADNKTGTLKTYYPDNAIECEKDSPIFDLDKKFTLSNPSKGPALGGSELTYNDKLDCNEAYSGGHPSQRGKNIERCEAVKKCVVDKGKTKFQCLQAWALCMEQNDDDTAKCKDTVGAGNVDEEKEEEDEKKNETTCAVDGIGWIICPVITFIASMVDAAYDYVLSTLLEVQPLTTTGEAEGVYEAWSIMRNFANVAFVIAFVVIILSQVSSIGITNYGIKKMLPRLIIAAILVNISYWVCAVAVDISNILGASIKDVFDSIGASLKPPEVSGVQTGNGWTGIAAVILAGTAVALFATLSIFLPILVTVAFAIITVLLVLALRQALIVLLIVIAPLAFVAYLLPNTEDLFTKWRKLFQTLLLMYPIIGLIFGASALASQVVTKTAGDNFGLQIMGAGIAIIPLFITPIVMKTAGSLLNLAAGKINQPREGLRKKAKDYSDYRRDVARTRRMNGTNMFSAAGARIKARGGRVSKFVGGGLEKTGTVGQKLGLNAASGYMEQRALTREQRRASAEKALAEAKQAYIAENAKDVKFAQSIAGPTGNIGKIQAAAIAAEKAETAKAIENARISAELSPGDKGIAEMASRFADAINRGDSIQARAMQDAMLSAGSSGLTQYRKSMEGVDENTMRSDIGTALRENMLLNHSSVKKDAADFIAQAASGDPMAKVSKDPKTWSGLSDDELVHQKNGSIQVALDANAIGQEQALRIAGNEELAKHISEDIRKQIEEIATRPPQAPPVT